MGGLASLRDFVKQLIIYGQDDRKSWPPPPLRSARGLDKENWVNILINTFGRAGRLTPQPHPPNLFYKFPIYW